MLHGRTDYDPIQDPRENGIGKDEPVMVFRAKDALAPLALDSYAGLIRQRMNDPELADQVEKQAQRMRDWQDVNGKDHPDVYFHHYLDDEDGEQPEESGEYEEVPQPPSSSPDVPVSPGYDFAEVRDEKVVFDDHRTAQLAHTPVVPGTLSLIQGQSEFQDNGSQAVLGEGSQQVGTIDYETGRMQMMHGGEFTAGYDYLQKNATVDVEDEVPHPTDDLDIVTHRTEENKLDGNTYPLGGPPEKEEDTPKDDMEVTQHLAGEMQTEGTETGRLEGGPETNPVEEVERGTSESGYTPPGKDPESSEDAEGPLSEGGAALMGGQPTEHTSGVPDAPPENSF